MAKKPKYKWIPRITYKTKIKNYVFFMDTKGLTKDNAAQVFEHMFGDESTELAINFKRIKG